MTYLDPVAGAFREGNVGADELEAGALAATTAGRAVMASGFFDAATAADKFAAQALPVAKVGLRVVEAHTAGDTLTTAESGSVHTNTGASGAVTLVLPAAVVGLEFFFAVGAAQQLRIDPNGTETVGLPSTGAQQAAGAYIWADAIGESVHLLCAVAGTWTVMGYTGTWTAV